MAFSFLLFDCSVSLKKQCKDPFENWYPASGKPVGKSCKIR